MKTPAVSKDFQTSYTKIFDSDGIEVLALPTMAFRKADGSERRKNINAQKIGRDKIISEYFGSVHAVTHNPDGSPRLVDTVCGCTTLSISHCSSLVVIAIDKKGRAIGIDAETSNRLHQLHKIATRILSPKQLERWGDNLLRAWTIKEALYKAIGIPGIALKDIPLPEPTLSSGKSEIETFVELSHIAYPHVTCQIRSLVFPGFDGAITLATKFRECFSRSFYGFHGSNQHQENKSDTHL